MNRTMTRLSIVTVSLALSACSSFKIYEEAQNKAATDLLTDVNALDLRAVITEARVNRDNVFAKLIAEAERSATASREAKFLQYAKGERTLGELKNDIATTEYTIFDGAPPADPGASPASLRSYRNTLQENQALKAKAATNHALSLRGFISHVREQALNLRAHAGHLEQHYGVSGLECQIFPLDLLPNSDPDELTQELETLTSVITHTVLEPDNPITDCEAGVTSKPAAVTAKEQRFFALAGLKRPQVLVKLAPQKIKIDNKESCEEGPRSGQITLWSQQLSTASEQLEIPPLENERRTESAARFAASYTAYAKQCVDLRLGSLRGLEVLQEAGLNAQLLNSNSTIDCGASLGSHIDAATTLRSAIIRDNCISAELADEQLAAQKAALALKSAEAALKEAQKLNKDEQSNTSDTGSDNPEQQKNLAAYLASISGAMSDLSQTSSVFGLKLLSEEELTTLALITEYLNREENPDAEGKGKDLPLKYRRALAVAEGIPELQQAIEALKEASKPVTIELEAKKSTAALMSEYATRKAGLKLAERHINNELLTDTLEALSLLDLAAETYQQVTEEDDRCGGIEQKTLAMIMNDKDLAYKCKERAISAVISALNAEKFFRNAVDRADYKLIANQSHQGLLEEEMIAAAHQDLIVVPAKVLAGWHASGFKPDNVAQLIVNALGFWAIANQL